jgi:hypothetical protein
MRAAAICGPERGGIIGDFVLHGSASVISLSLRPLSGRSGSGASIATDGRCDGSSNRPPVMYHLQSLAAASPPAAAAAAFGGVLGATTCGRQPAGGHDLQRRTNGTCTALVALMQGGVGSRSSPAHGGGVLLGTAVGAVGGGDATVHHAVARGVTRTCELEHSNSTAGCVGRAP